MSKRKAKQEQTTGDDEMMQDQNAELEADQPQDDEPAQQAATEQGGQPQGVREYNPDAANPNDPNNRPGQGYNRDDALDANYRAAQGGTFAGDAINASGELQRTADSDEHKPAEPYDDDSRDSIKPNPYPVAKPAVEVVESGRIPGAGDPQNGTLTPEGKSPVAWANPARDVAQHYFPPEETGDANAPQAAPVSDSDAIERGQMPTGAVDGHVVTGETGETGTTDDPGEPA
jgi:hypothetical protein